MHPLIPLLLITLAAWSCKENKGNGEPGAPTSGDSTAVQPYDPKTQLHLQTMSHTEIDSSGIFILPLTAGEHESRQKGGYYKEMPVNTYWNIIFYNSRTTATHLLSDRKMLIDEYNCSPANYSDERRTTSPRHIFYYIRVLDHDQNKLLNSNDPKYLFVTDKEGYHFKQLSPDGYDIRSWQFVKGANKVLMLAVADSDRNRVFDDEDEMAAFETGLDSAARPVEIVSPELKQQLKILYDRDWKRLNRQ